jgi:hypothetical protein
VRQAPSDFDGGRERGVEGRRVQTDEPDERSRLPHLDGPEPPTALFQAGSDAIHEDVALGVAQRGREVLHHDGIGVEGRERRAVLVAPAAQEQARGLEDRHLTRLG